MSNPIVEYRGAEGLVYAEVTEDTRESISFGTVKPLAGLAQVTKAANSSDEAHYYDNIPAIVITSDGADTITLNVSAIPLDVQADIYGEFYDAETGMLVEQERTPKYFALGYITENTAGQKIYVWRLKGRFGVADETSATKNDGTDANGQELTYTGIKTTYKFNKNGKSASGVIVNTGLDLADTDTFFDSVQTPDTVQPKSETPSISLSASALTIEAGNEATVIATAVPNSAVVAWTSSAESVATVDGGTITAVAEGTATITAKITVGSRDYSATCAVTVTPSQA